MADKKQKKKSGFFRSAYKNYFNVPRWLSLDMLKDSTDFYWNSSKHILKVDKDKPIEEETFAEAMNRLGIKESEIASRITFQNKMAVVFGLGGFLGLLYGLHFLIAGKYYAFILACTASAVALARAFQSHFWAFQMKHRKLGCSLDEWFNGKVKS